jgi:hypothetical protein
MQATPRDRANIRDAVRRGLALQRLAFGTAFRARTNAGHSRRVATAPSPAAGLSGPRIGPADSRHDRYKEELAVEMGKPIVSDPELQSIIDDLYRMMPVWEAEVRPPQFARSA